KTYEWHCRLLRGKKRSYESPAGEESFTKVRFLETDKNGFLHWQVMPLTGRPHQIRFELSRHGFPILGDILYGSKQVWKPNEIALRAVKLKMKKIFSDMPTEFVAKGLRK